jgi:hypothetical protein
MEGLVARGRGLPYSVGAPCPLHRAQSGVQVGEPYIGRTAGPHRLPAAAFIAGVRLPCPGTLRGTGAALVLRMQRGFFPAVPRMVSHGLAGGQGGEPYIGCTARPHHLPAAAFAAGYDCLAQAL